MKKQSSPEKQLTKEQIIALKQEKKRKRRKNSMNFKEKQRVGN